MEQKKRDNIIIVNRFDERYGKIKELLTCFICKKLLRKVTTIDECLHKFCRACIEKKIIEEKLCNCPVCNVDLGVYPLHKLRADYRWQSLRDNIKFRKQQLIESGEEKDKKPQQASEEAKEPELVPVRRKEKSIYSVMKAEKACMRILGGRKVVPPRNIKETEDDFQTYSSSHLNLRSGIRGIKIFEEGDVGGSPKSYHMLQPTSSHAHLENENECISYKSREPSRRGTRVQDHENGSVSGGSTSAQYCDQAKGHVVTEDLNVPTRMYVDSNNCYRLNQLWFTFVASNEQTYYLPLPPIPPCYLMVKNPNMSVSSIRKYLVKKLNLFSEEELEFSLWGQLISPDSTVKQMVDLWLLTTPISEKKSGIVGGSGKDLVMVLTYRRRNLFSF